MRTALCVGLILSAFYASSSHAQCTAFPYNLANGQTADAGQVMTNYNYLSNCLAPRNTPTFSGTVAMSYNGVNHGILFDDGNFHISGLLGNLWLDAGSNAVSINNQSDGNVLLTNSNGNVGIGTNSPSFPLDVQSSKIGVYSNMGCATTFGALNAQGVVTPSCGQVNDAPVSIRANGRIVAPEVDAISDMRLKTFVSNLKPASSLQTVSQLRPLFFTWKPESGQHDSSLKVGFFAQDVINQIPSAVMQGPGVLPDQYFLNYEAIIPYLVSAVQELMLQNQVINHHLESQAANAAFYEGVGMKFAAGTDGAVKRQDDVAELIPTLLAAIKSQQVELETLKLEVQSLRASH